MKALTTNYSFNAAAKTVTLLDFTSLALERLLLITNLTDGITIYQFNDLTKSGTVAGNVLTLTYDTSAMSNTDKLQIFYDDDSITATIPQGPENALRVRGVPAKIDRISFAKTLTGSVDSDWGAVTLLGSGMAVNQTGGNLVITTGVTVNSETIIRGNLSYVGGVRLRARTTLSQRIANQSFFVELVDVIADGAAITINSATSVTVTVNNHNFTTANVGQYMYLGAYSGSGTFIPGRYAIASIPSTNTINFTVASFAVGSGTCSLFGWNYYHLLYDGTTATSAKFDTQRKGWNTGDTSVTINTTASPGHLALMTGNDLQAAVSDALVASNTGVQMTHRGSRVENVPDDATLRVQLRVVNGSTAPASTTTWTVGMVSVGNYAALDTVVQDVRPVAPTSALPVQVSNSPSVIIGSGTVTTVSTVTTTASVTQSGVALPVQTNPIASAAITATTTTALAPTNGGAIVLQLNVTAVSGTSPTLDATLQESYDNGTTWVSIYQFPRVTAVLTTPLFSPPLKVSGSKLQLVQTVTGTSPSFTRAVFMDQINRPVESSVRQILDRSVTLTTAASTTATLTTQGIAQNAQLIINIGAATTAPALQLQASEDGGASWISLGTPLTAVASSTVQTTVTGITTSLLRAVVTTAGSSVTAGYVLLRVF